MHNPKNVCNFAERKTNIAAVAQLVEHQLPKLRVAGSSPVCRSCLDRVRILQEALATCSFFYTVNKDYALEELTGLMRFIVFRVLIFGT